MASSGLLETESHSNGPQYSLENILGDDHEKLEHPDHMGIASSVKHVTDHPAEVRCGGHSTGCPERPREHTGIFAPPMSCATLSPIVQLDPDAPGTPAVTREDSTEPRIPNVYINGLPPNFPEEQLHALTKDFGGVVNVRTFTRHNFHRIPGTRYASLPFSSTSLSPSLSPPGTDDDSFKSRMERLKDESSTNLYIEGLPLSIDEPSMAALVAPYTIKSSRFFQTRLTHPPRTIVFVRLETRSACEDIIKRLHGRMLRRSERSAGRGDDSSPARLTMAPAALLNLKGQQVQGHLRAQQHLTTVSDQRRIQSVQSQPNLHDLTGMHHQHSRLPPHPVITQCQSEPENLTTSHSVPTHLQGRVDTKTSVALSSALGCDIDLSALSRAASANGFTPLKGAYKRKSTHAGDRDSDEWICSPCAVKLNQTRTNDLNAMAAIAY
ncbi:hypothetical protein EI94DRAFT_1806447 [Lactarius quietus]|nr:hypothetical protein EI94DRAFT_1806447 [Lactarius quietus]